MRKSFCVALIGTFILIGFSVYINSVFAETVPSYLDPAKKAQNTVSLPEIYLRDLTLNKKVYTVGETVMGSFTLLNNGNQSASDFYVQTALIDGSQKNVLSAVSSDSKKMGSYSLKGKESKKIDFTYTLPKGVVGDSFGVRFSIVLSSGFRLTWKDSPIKIQGKIGMLDSASPSLLIGINKFSLLDNPTVPENEKIFLLVTLTNTASGNIEIVPKIKVSNKSQPSSVYPDFVLGTTAILASSSLTVKYELPKFDNQAGIYEGQVNFFDMNDVERATGLNLSYSIPGGSAVSGSGATSNTNRGGSANYYLAIIGWIVVGLGALILIISLNFKKKLKKILFLSLLFFVLSTLSVGVKNVQAEVITPDIAGGSENVLVNAVCNKEAVNVCSAGNFEDIQDTFTSYLWKCNGKNGGKSVSCSLAAPKKDVACGLKKNTCLAGTFSDLVDNATEFHWICSGGANSTNLFCSVPITTTNFFSLTSNIAIYLKLIGLVILVGIIFITLRFKRRLK
jgi:hypothetical protein